MYILKQIAQLLKNNQTEEKNFNVFKNRIIFIINYERKKNLINNVFN